MAFTTSREVKVGAAFEGDSLGNRLKPKTAAIATMPTAAAFETKPNPWAKGRLAPVSTDALLPFSECGDGTDAAPIPDNSTGAAKR
jgi:hypothetical protein